MTIEIRPLERQDALSSFECGMPELDLFLKKYAKQNQFRHYIGTTYVAAADREVLGYFSISASSIRIDELSDIIEKKLPQYPLPILRLTRLAVDRRHQGSGIGHQLLKHALKLTLEQKEHFGCFGIVVDAKEGSAPFYREFGFETFEVVSGALDVRPYAQSMFLATKVIERSLQD